MENGIVFKKGHTIPRWCHVRAVDRKAQHCATFGCDVSVRVLGGVVEMRALSNGPLIVVNNARPQRRMANGTYKMVPVAVKDIIASSCTTFISGGAA